MLLLKQKALKHKKERAAVRRLFCYMEAKMKYQIKHECRGRLRVQITQSRMTMEQADLLEEWLRKLPDVERAVVHERTRCAVVE